MNPNYMADNLPLSAETVTPSLIVLCLFLSNIHFSLFDMFNYHFQDFFLHPDRRGEKKSILKLSKLNICSHLALCLNLNPLRCRLLPCIHHHRLINSYYITVSLSNTTVYLGMFEETIKRWTDACLSFLKLLFTSVSPHSVWDAASLIAAYSVVSRVLQPYLSSLVNMFVGCDHSEIWDSLHRH